MTDLRQAAMLALEALESSRIFVITREKTKHPEGTEWYDSAITALKAALEQPEQEPVAWMYTSRLAGNQQYITRFQHDLTTYKADKVWPLYTTPPAAQRPWVGLTDDEVSELSLSRRYLVREVEAKLKEKNT